MRKQKTATLLVRGQRLGIFNLSGVCRNGKLLVYTSVSDLRPGDMVWELGPRENPPDFARLYVVVWMKSWTRWDSLSKRFLVKFREATAGEFSVETVMNE